MIRALLTVLLAATPIAASAQQPQPLRGHERITDPRPQPRGEALLRNAVLSVHNRARVAYGVRPLVYDNRLAADAMVYAQTLARTGRFAHDPQIGRRTRQGENLWMGTRGAYRYERMIQLMVDERADFVPGIFPNVSRTGRWWEVGHYTQIIWPTTTRVGCAVTANRTDDYLVCRYLPGGNVVGTRLR